MFWNPSAKFPPSLLLGVILILALALRLVAVGERSIWYDESVSLAISGAETMGQVTALCRQTAHPPLYHWALHPVVRAASSDTAPRLLSVAFGLAAVAAAWAVGRRLRDDATGALIALAMAVSPVAVHFSQELRMYSLFSLIGALQYLAAIEWVRRPRAPAAGMGAVASMGVAVGLAAATALALLTHYYAVFSTFGLMLWLCAESWRREGARGIARVGVIALLAALFFAPWMPVFIEHAHAHSLEGAMAQSAPMTFAWFASVFLDVHFGTVPVGPFGLLFGTKWDRILADFGLGTVLVVALWICGGMALWRRERKSLLQMKTTGSSDQSDQSDQSGLSDPSDQSDSAKSLQAPAPRAPADDFSRILLLALGMGVPLLLTLVHLHFHGRFYGRYLIVFQPLGFFWLSEGIRLPRARWAKAALAAALVLFLLPATLLLTRRDTRDCTRPASEWLAARMRPGDAIVHASPWSYFPFRFYLRREPNEQWLLAGPKVTMADRPLVPAERLVDGIAQIESRVAKNDKTRRVWLIMPVWSLQPTDENEKTLHREMNENGWRMVDAIVEEQGQKRMTLAAYERRR